MKKKVLNPNNFMTPSGRWGVMTMAIHQGQHLYINKNVAALVGVDRQSPLIRLTETDDGLYIDKVKKGDGFRLYPQSAGSYKITNKKLAEYILSLFEGDTDNTLHLNVSKHYTENGYLISKRYVRQSN